MSLRVVCRFFVKSSQKSVLISQENVFGVATPDCNAGDRLHSLCDDVTAPWASELAEMLLSVSGPSAKQDDQIYMTGLGGGAQSEREGSCCPRIRHAAWVHK